MASHPAALDRLPDDILFLILENLDTAGDQASLSGTCHKLHGFMQSEGWRAFTRRCFPGVFSAELQGQANANSSDGTNAVGHRSQIDASMRDGRYGEPGWSALAESLTWQSRAWDRRALAFQALIPKQDHIPRHKRPRPYMPSLAVHFQADLAESGKQLGLGVTGEEMLVIGAGEDIVARFRKRPPVETNDSVPVDLVMHVLDGQSAGYRPGFDDVRAVSVIENAMGMPRRRGILAGRDNGDVSLLSAEPDQTFGQLLAKFVPNQNTKVDQTRIYSIDLSTNPRHMAAFGSSLHGGLAAVTTPSDILFYPIPQAQSTPDSSGGQAADSPATIHSVSAFPLDEVGLYPNGNRQPFNARWMEAGGTLAVAMGAGANPLRYLTATPTGPVELTSAYTMPDLMEHYSLTDTTLVIPTSLTPVPYSSITGGNGHLTLSGWRDGTCRLQDLRTASPYDMIYQDNVLGPQEAAQAMLIWDTDRFITGNQNSAGLKVFDLRWPRRYYHTDALPCSQSLPFPTPPVPTSTIRSTNMSGLSLADGPGTPHRNTRPLPYFLPPELRTAQNWPPPAPHVPLHLRHTKRCDVLRSIRCRWHTASRDLFYRSSASLFLQRSLEAHNVTATGVFALVRASSSDLAPSNFYAGLKNCVVESYLHEQVVGVESPRYSGPRGGLSGQIRTAIWTDGGGAPYFGYREPTSGSITTAVKSSIGKGNKNANGKTGGSGDRALYQTYDLDVALMETGDSMAHPNIESGPMWLPRFRNRKYEFQRVPRFLFDKTTKEDMRGYDKRGIDAAARLDETTRIKKWSHRFGRKDVSEDTVSFRDRYQHRLDFGFQDIVDFQ
ncbi:uncharacterized protein SPSK_04010 [Sporothrix schenckii 1099-18]|uniref:F-box domain-containing protein n=2 Tax=Sporothrix schenckii TaxID=29908 RepID=U7PW39_SPOS1|nr:uncharacterized protein SPSK_04010 [Sporothrix schenckii 1099-18]ERS99146.1 hypothetical protein HMPREF1624_04342 [Sporothrix schenckii ATCC 58251]KJR83187.1 hypothetical protein SPSK_04010 [Sporothrix schenckii 1099-18]